MNVQYKFSQTNLQLFYQMHKLDFTCDDLQLVNQSYTLAAELMSGQYRASYKPVVAHLVGTASVLAWIGSQAEVISAGLLHAIYETGDFGDSQPPGSNSERRTAVQNAVGSDIEAIVNGYQSYAWNVDAIRSIVQRAPMFEQLETDLIMVRLANELEDLLDFGLAYCGENRRKQAIYQPRHFDLVVQLANLMNHPKLARELKAMFDANQTTTFPRDLRGVTPPVESFSVAPRSYEKLKTAIAQRLQAQKN